MKTRLLLFVACSIGVGLPPSVLGAAWGAGVDVIAEASMGRAAGTVTAGAQQGLALAHVEWQQSRTAADGGVRFRSYASLLSLAGHGPTGRFLGDLLGASNIEGYASTRLYSTWLEAGMGDWSLRAGALLADEEFVLTRVGASLVNSSFGWPAFISANTVNTGPAFYAAAPGVRVEHRAGETTTWRMGLYDGDSFDSPEGDPRINRHGRRYRVGGDQGFFAISEVELAPAHIVHRAKLGGWLHTARFPDLRGDGASSPDHRSNYGAYAVLERTLVGESEKQSGVEAFLRGGVSPADRNTLSWAIDSGVAWTGAFAGRPHDVTAMGISHARFSAHFTAHARAVDAENLMKDGETVVELSHRVTLAHNFSVVPDVQYIARPGGSALRRHALLWLIRFQGSL